MKYQALPKIESKDHVLQLLDSNDIEVLRLLPLSLGDQCPEHEKTFAQDTCLTLANSLDPATRANAILGLAYIARRHRWLDKRTVKPFILREFRENEEFNWRIVDAIEDINLFLGWRLAKKRI